MSYQSLDILNKFPIKIAQCLDYFCSNCCLETLSLSKKRVTTVITFTYQYSFLWVHPFILVYPHRNLIHHRLNHSPLKNAALNLSFELIRIRYKQKHVNIGRISQMDRCLTRLIEGTVLKKAYRSKVRYVGTVRFKN